MLRILRGLLGLLIGVSYGVLVGALTYVYWRLTNDPRYPGPMIPDNNAWGRLITFFATVLTGFCGALVGSVVGLTGFNKIYAAAFGAALGLVLFVLLSQDLWTDPTAIPTMGWPSVLARSGIVFLVFPVGLALIGLLVSIITRRMVKP